MSNLIRKLLGYDNDNTEVSKCLNYTVAIVESVSAGTLSNSFCTKKESSNYFKGGIVAYSLESQKELLDNQYIDISQKNTINYANIHITSILARTICKKFNARIGIACTGFSLPFYKENFKVEQPYAYICLYDTNRDAEIMHYMEFKETNDRPRIQAKIGLEGRKMYLNYIKSQDDDFILVE